MFKQNQNVKREMQPKKHRRAATWGPFKTMYTCRQSSARQHRSTRAASIHDDISTPGGRWASRGGGGASHVDAPGSNLDYSRTVPGTWYSKRTSSFILEGVMLISSRILFALPRTPGNKAPRTSGLLVWFACLLFAGDLCDCCVVVLAVGCVLCTAVLM